MYRLALCVLLCLALFLTLLGSVTVEAQPAQEEKPRLVVLIVVDQFRGDYLERWGELFGPGGFDRFTRGGAWFKNCHYPYGNTITAAGHASIATGCGPNRHGIVANEWYDRQSGKDITSVESERYLQVPPRPGKKSQLIGASPERRLQPAVADSLQKATGGKGKVVSLSLKDRAAILLAGLFRCICYWFSSENGGFVTSRYYRESPHPWVEKFNQSKMAEHWFGKEWGRLRPHLDYEKYSGPDLVLAEGVGYKQGRAFPHPTTGGLKAPGTAYYNAVTASPFGGELLAALAKEAVVAEKLGQDEIPDLLCLSFSNNDIIGHIWGPDSQEVLDVTLRTDALLRDFFAFLDRQVGKGKYAVILSADHGICPIPELAAAQGKNAGRVSSVELARRMNTYLDTLYSKTGGPAQWLEEIAPPWVYLDQRLLQQRKIPVAEVEEALVKWLPTQSEVAAAYTSKQMQGKGGDHYLDMYQRSYYPGRSGDVTIRLHPYHQFSSYLTGTTHGSPYPYDTHVPLVVFGPGIKAGTHQEAVTPQACAAIAAQLLGIAPPAGAEAPLPKALKK